MTAEESLDALDGVAVGLPVGAGGSGVVAAEDVEPAGALRAPIDCMLLAWRGLEGVGETLPERIKSLDGDVARDRIDGGCQWLDCPNPNPCESSSGALRVKEGLPAERSKIALVTPLTSLLRFEISRSLFDPVGECCSLSWIDCSVGTIVADEALLDYQKSNT